VALVEQAILIPKEKNHLAVIKSEVSPEALLRDILSLKLSPQLFQLQQNETIM
jgi:hypothetical protein